MAQTVLIVEDDTEVAQVVRDYLERSGFRVESAGDGASAVSLFRHRPADLVLLDLNLPGMDGLEVARQLRRSSRVPIIMVTARVEESDRLIGLELGADDYVVKPFSPREIVARVRAVLRRAAGELDTSPILRAGEVELDRARHTVLVGGRLVDLTPTEFSLLETLLRSPGVAFSRAQLLDAVQGSSFAGYERTIDAHIKNLRAKIEVDPGAPRIVQTVFGVGYRLSDDSV